jgi:putative methyltransferase (TIGR04325 family)
MSVDKGSHRLEAVRHGAVDLSKAVAGLVLPPRLQESVYRSRFLRATGWRNLHLGRFDGFEQARDYARSHGVKVGYVLDHRAWLAERSELHPHDYPVLFWLSEAIANSGAEFRVADLGGSVGVSYYLYARYLKLPADLRWTVCELDDVVALGRQIAAERGVGALDFSADRGAALDGADLLLAAGALQFIEEPLERILASLARPPRHLLLNRVALGEQLARSYVTLQNTGCGIAPCRVEPEAAFEEAIRARGYRLVDRWRCLENRIDVPLHDDCRIERFVGLYFRREA